MVNPAKTQIKRNVRDENNLNTLLSSGEQRGPNVALENVDHGKAQKNPVLIDDSNAMNMTEHAADSHRVRDGEQAPLESDTARMISHGSETNNILSKLGHKTADGDGDQDYPGIIERPKFENSEMNSK